METHRGLLMGNALVDTIQTSRIVLAGVVGLGYFAGAELGHLLSLKVHDQAFATFWPPAGILLAALVLVRYGAWPVALLAACVANLASDVLLHEKSVPVSLGFFLANCGEACIGAWLLRRFVGVPFRLARIEEVLGLAGLSALLSTVFGASLGAAVVKFAFNHSYWPVWQLWWISDSLGVLIVAPVIFTWAAEQAILPGGARPWRVVEGAALVLGLVAAAVCVYGELFPRTLNVPVYILPFLLWAGFRFGPPGAAAAILVVSVIALWNVSQGRGPFAALAIDPRERLMRGQATLLVISLCVAALAAVVAERKQAERHRTKLIGELETALTEIKTLRGLIPVCAWCKKMRDDQGFWQQLEDYLRQHTEATFTHGMCPECMDRQLASMQRRS
jgi:integral membrane sensor domain MASE1